MERVAHLTPDDLVSRWRGQVKRGTLANWRTRGEGPRFIKFGRAVLYPADEVERFERERLRSAVSIVHQSTS